MTKLESYLRGTKDNETFVGRLVKPVYNISSIEIKIITTLLFFYGFYKLRLWERRQRKKIKNMIILSLKNNYIYKTLFYV